MTENQNQIEWRVIGESVIGASHIRSNTPNQDAILTLRESSRDLPVFLAVADGHGSAKCFRSDTGSRFAVSKALQTVTDFFNERRGAFQIEKIENDAKDFLPAEIVKRWRKAVEKHLKANPFSEEELAKLTEKSGDEARKLVEENPLLAYGTTILTTAVEKDFILYLQLGDGDILNVSKTGEVKRALPEDERLFANETTSLCLPTAEKDFRFFVQRVTPEDSPALVMLSTDGYVNSFSEEAGFLQAASDFWNFLGSEGHDFISENLKTWLEETTQTGSGDDTTVGLIYRPDFLPKHEKKATVKHVEETEKSPIQNQTDGEKIETRKTENGEDVTVTITIKKDKNKLLEPHAETNPKDEKGGENRE